MNETLLNEASARIVSAVDEVWCEMNRTDEEGNIYGNVAHAWSSMCDDGRDRQIVASAVGDNQDEALQSQLVKLVHSLINTLVESSQQETKGNQ